MKASILPLMPLLCIGWVAMVKAADFSSMYDRNTLQYWGQRYAVSTQRYLDEVIWPVLRANEIQALAAKPSLKFPLFAEGDPAASTPLSFYSNTYSNSIGLPVLSLKFLDDLCTAYAWLQINGYGLETISEYTALLFYAKPPAGGYPPPLKALKIPETALADPKVDELALNHFGSARTFILLHELGHLRFDHRFSPDARNIPNEKQADKFAAEVMQRTPLPPIGMLVWFLADAHATASQMSVGSHPLSGERLYALAENIDDRDIANELRGLAVLIDDPDIRTGFIASGKAGNYQALAPRRPHELPGLIADRPASGWAEARFEGLYRGEYVQHGGDAAAIPLSFELKRRGETIAGSYTFGLGVGQLDNGIIENKRLYLDWAWAGNAGRAVLELKNDGSLTGTWGYGLNRQGGGTWFGQPVVTNR
ncbi:hypothetical protein NP590_19430 [Methylomonas sp. SURF-2]|uniref:IrrE N-terminal-like domain-containing protein n=1 Tax=Methylomonas subterranea TaxID=2952225 RepID=A0ABT1TLD9_9GAMM|nr:hypothetical protein [Methylomonas sp. SURF-2]MCQ8106286.1 hypothetical protein [Methylomonas sp. SURF-2]